MMDFDKIKTYPLASRKNKFSISQMIPLCNEIQFENEALGELALDIMDAKAKSAPIVFMLGGAVIKEGCSALLIDLMKNGFMTHMAMNGSVTIHDFELAFIGETSEDVLGGLFDGSFGMIEETGAHMNAAIIKGYERGKGYGLAIAEKIEELSLKHKEISVVYQAKKMNVKTTVHVAIGGDIIHQHPTCSGAALGATSYEDFKILTETMTTIKNGVVVNIGSAVIMPEVFLKALTIARNLGYRHNEFTVANFDFLDMYRPRTRVLEWPKSLGAKAYYVKGRHSQTIPKLHKLLCL
jgi:deoxyhypusine synthase